MDNTLKAEAGIYAVSGMSANLSVQRHWTRLFEAAEQIFGDGHYGAAVVVAASACEVVVDRAITFGFRNKKVVELEGPVTDLLFSSQITGEKNRVLYEALTGDKEINKRPFWESYTRLVKDRHRVAHAGESVDADDARRDLEAAREFVAHVEQHNGLA